MKTFDAAVIGLGTMGAYACATLAARGYRVLGLDRFSPPHDRGSHSGHTRVFRIAYAENPNYVPLGKRALELWKEYEERSGRTILHQSGVLSLGETDGPLMRGTIGSAVEYGLPLERLTAAEVRRRFPAFAPPENYEGLFESAAGWLEVDAALQVPLAEARHNGAEILLNTHLENWRDSGTHIEFETSGGRFAAERLVLTGGAWMPKMLGDLALPLRVERRVMMWIKARQPELFRSPAFPVFVFDAEFLYGFPDGGGGVKLALHWRPAPETQDPDEIVRPGDVEDAAPILRSAKKILPSLMESEADGLERVAALKTCLYTISPDENFVIDVHPLSERVVFATGFSGHGFKFAPAVGEALAELVMGGQPRVPMQFLRQNRFSGATL